MDWLFGRAKSPKEIIREHQRTITRAIRELDREKTRLEAEEKKTIREIKKLAKEGQMGAAKIQAKNVVRTRQYVTKFIKMRAQLQAVSLRITTLKSTASMSEAMKGVTRAMMVMNRQINLPAMQRIMMEFEKQSEFMDMKEEVMNETIDEAMEGEEDEEEEENALIAKVMDDIGIDLSEQLVDAPRQEATAAAVASSSGVALAEGLGAGGGPGGPSGGNNTSSSSGGGGGLANPSSGGGGGGGGSDLDDLQARLDALKK